MSMGSGFRMLLWIILVSFFTVSVSGAEFHVSTANDLTSALQAATTNGEDDTIELVASTYRGNFSYQPKDGKDLTLRGVAKTTPDKVILDGGGKGTVLVFVASSHGGSVTIAGITLQNGKVPGDYGGGIKVVAKDG